MKAIKFHKKENKFEKNLEHLRKYCFVKPISSGRQSSKKEISSIKKLYNKNVWAIT